MKRTTRLLLLAVALVVAQPGFTQTPATPQSDTAAKVKRIGKRMMCLCGCNQILTECNHVGCSVSAEMLKKLEQRVARNEPEDLTIQSFVQEYGQQVLAEPPSKGLGQLAWLMPIAALLAGGVIVMLVLNRMRAAIPASATPAGRMSPEALEQLRQRASRESGE